MITKQIVFIPPSKDYPQRDEPHDVQIKQPS